MASVLAAVVALAAGLGGVSYARAAEVPGRQMEHLTRGLVGIHQGQGKVFLSWRMFATDPANVAFNVYRAVGGRAPVKLNAEPIADVTWFVDEHAALEEATSYSVRAVIDGAEQSDDGRPFAFAAHAPVRPYLEVPLKTPAGYQPNDASVADLDGDGDLEIVLHQAGRGRDNSQAGETDPPVLQAYKLDGTLLWTINLGKNIREGAHYTQFMVYDLDGDGKAEVVCKTADGSVDGRGKTIGDASKDWRNDRGYIVSGPEYLTVFSGQTGAALDTVPYVPARAPTLTPSGDELKAIWGDGYGNRVDRFLACVAYLDGVHPSVVMCRGYYTRAVLAAWDFKGGRLAKRWVFDSDSSEANRGYRGQGNHNLSVADVDGDGRDEIIYGACTINADGTGRYSTGYGHADTLHAGDLDPDHPGLEVFDIQERFSDAGMHMIDAKTGATLWKIPSVKAAESGGDKGEGPARGVAFNVDPRHPGSESWARGAGMTGMYDAKGKRISDKQPGSCNFAVYWDGDLLQELLDGNHIDKWDWKNEKTERLLTAEGCSSVNGTKSTPCISGDILGDWREEVVWRTTDGQALRIYTTTIPTAHRMYTLLQDPQYRLSLVWQNVAYNQPPHTSFYIDEQMKAPPKPKIVMLPGAGK